MYTALYTHLSLNIRYILCVSLRCRDWYENKQYRPWQKQNTKQENSVSISFTLPSVETAIQNPALGQLVLSRSSKKLTIFNNLKLYFHTWNAVLICSKCTSVQLKSFQMELDWTSTESAISSITSQQASKSQLKCCHMLSL